MADRFWKSNLLAGMDLPKSELGTSTNVWGSFCLIYSQLREMDQTMLKKFIEWIKSLFTKKTPETVVAEEPHPLINFMSAPIVCYLPNNYLPIVGTVIGLGHNTENKPFVIVRDYISNREYTLTEGFVLFKNSELKETQENLRQIHGDDLVPSFEKVSDILDEAGFYKVADLYFVTVNSKDT